MKTPQGAAQVGWWRPTSFCLAALLTAGCNLDNPGISPPEAKIAYPVALAMSDDGSHLFVVNSNFDLRYNAGSVHSYDLTKLAEFTASPGGESCAVRATRGGGGAVGFPDGGVPDNTMYPEDPDLDAGLDDAGLDDAGLDDAGLDDAGLDDAGLDDAGLDDAGSEQGANIVLPPSVEFGSQGGILCDGVNDYADNPCCLSSEVAQKQGIFVNQVLTDSYASGLALSPDKQRLYVTVRSGNRLLYLDVVEGPGGQQSLSCGGAEGDCARGPDSNDRSEADGEKLPPTPTAVVAGMLGQLGVTGQDQDAVFIATTHEQGQLSLFVDRDKGAGSRGPVLEDIVGGPVERLTSVSLSGQSPTEQDAPQLLYVTSSLDSTISRVGVAQRREGDATRLLYGTSSIAIQNLTTPKDLRNVQVDPNDPSQLFVLIRGTLQSLAFLKLDDTSLSEARVVDAVGLGSGPSKVVLGNLTDEATGAQSSFLFAISYNAGAIFVIDPKTRDTLAVIRGFSGPYDMVIDESRTLMYVADFRASVVRVVSLDGLLDRSKAPPRIIATLGKLTFPERIR